MFDVAVGERAISHMGHIKMMAAVQPFISGAISKTVNMPETATVEDIADAYIQAWHLGLKALAIYRDGSKTAQALRTDAQKGADAGTAAISQADVEKAVAEALAKTGAGAPRCRASASRSRTSSRIGGHEGYITAGLYEDGSVGEIFLTDIGKEGSTLRGMMNSFATAISIALQYGVPLETLVRKFSLHALRARGHDDEPGDPVREVAARLHHALARLALPRRGAPGGARDHDPGACASGRWRRRRRCRSAATPPARRRRAPRRARATAARASRRPPR